MGILVVNKFKYSIIKSIKLIVDEEGCGMHRVELNTGDILYGTIEQGCSCSMVLTQDAVAFKKGRDEMKGNNIINQALKDTEWDKS